MINNNRQAGRRRGRGGQRQGGGNPNSGNRIDNRARGNASQLLEKYKTLAADAQRQGDRVNAEYYLQFADHYFRVLAESRSRFEEQNQRRGREDSFDDEDEGFDEDGNDIAADSDQPRRQQQSREDRGDNGRGQDGQREQREFRGRDRQERGDREQREQREDRGNRMNGNAYAANDSDEGERPEVIVAPEGEREPPRRGRPRREAKPVAANEGETFDAALLPPSLGISVGDESELGGEEASKPRRGRPRRTPGAEAAE